MTLRSWVQRAASTLIKGRPRRQKHTVGSRPFQPTIEALEERSLLSLGPPVLLPGDLNIGPAAGTQATPQIARGTTTSLAVWIDNRTMLNSVVNSSVSPISGPQNGSMTDVYAARIDATTGQLIDTTPIIISQAPFNQVSPHVAWNGKEWLVAWSTQPDQNHTDVVAARVSAAGIVLDSTPIMLQAAPTFIDTYQPWAVSSNGDNFSVIWRGIDATTGIFTLVGGRVASDGTVLDPGGKVVRHDFFNSSPVNADLAFAGGQYLMTWMELDPATGGNTVRGERLTSTLGVTGPVFTIDHVAGTVPGAPRVASNSSSFFVTWSENRFYGFAQVYGARVSTAGQVLDPNGIAITKFSGSFQFEPAPAWDGANWFVAYDRTVPTFDQDIYVTRVSPTGRVRDASGIKVFGTAPANQNQPAITPKAGGGVEILWTDFKAPGPSPEDIFGTTVSSSGVVAAPAAISQGASRQSQPRLAAGSGGFLSVFLSDSSGVTRILAERLDTAGNPVDSAPIVLAAGPGSLGSPSVAWNGSVYLVVWNDMSQNFPFGEILARRVSAAGQILDAAPIPIMKGKDPDVSALGSTFLVADTVLKPDLRDTLVTVVRVDGNGTVLGTPAIIGGHDATTRIAAVGNRWLVVWTVVGSTSVINGAFVAADGTFTPSFFVTSGFRNVDTLPAIASSGNAALVVWTAGDLLANSDIRGRLILADGTMNPIFDISSAPEGQAAPAVAWDGKQFVVTWTDHRNEPFPQQPRGDIYAARVDAAGNLLDPSGFAVANSPLPEDTPTVAAANGVTVFAYSAFQPLAPFAAMRLTLRTLTGGSILAAPPLLAPTVASPGVAPASTRTASPGVRDIDELFAQIGSKGADSPDSWGLSQSEKRAILRALSGPDEDAAESSEDAAGLPHLSKHKSLHALE